MNSPLDFDWLGVAFVDDSVPDRKKFEDELCLKSEELLEQAKESLDEWLRERGLEQVMGMIRQIKGPEASQKGELK